MLNLYFLRHGESGFDAPSDVERVLTTKGHHDTSALYGHFLKDKLSNFDTVFCSPYQRTQQSCDNVLSSFSDIEPAHTQLKEQLVPNSTPEAISDFLYADSIATQKSQHDQHILIVTHMPIIAYVLAFLVEGELRAANQYAMQPGSCAHISCDTPLRGLAHLQGIHHPDSLNT